VFLLVLPVWLTPSRLFFCFSIPHRRAIFHDLSFPHTCLFRSIPHLHGAFHFFPKLSPQYYSCDFLIHLPGRTNHPQSTRTLKQVPPVDHYHPHCALLLFAFPLAVAYTGLVHSLHFCSPFPRRRTDGNFLTLFSLMNIFPIALLPPPSLMALSCGVDRFV